MSQPLAHTAVAKGESVLAMLVGGQFSAVNACFESSLQPVISAETLARAWQQITAEAGSFRSVVSSRPEPADDPALCLVTFTCAFERGRLLACMLVDSDGRLSGLWFHPKPD